jgi:NADPH2:quinone reductase
MQAAWYTKNGEAREVLIVGEQPTPTPAQGEVRVKLLTSGVNPSDVKSRKSRPIHDPRIIPHSDGAGIIDAVGAGVSPSRIGERVWVWNGQWQRPAGTAAQYISLPEQQAVVLPDHIDNAAAACFGIPALTAIQAVHLAGDVHQKTVLVTGASSAVGHYIAQLLALKGAQVIGTVGSEAKAAHARQAGCRDIIFYKTENVAERIKQITQGHGVDVIIDMDFATTSLLLPQGSLKNHGTLVCFGSNIAGEMPITFRPLLWGSITLKFFLVYDLTPEERVRCLDELNALLQKNALQHTIAATYPLKDIARAHEAVEQGQLIGNVVIALEA